MQNWSTSNLHEWTGKPKDRQGPPRFAGSGPLRQADVTFNYSLPATRS